MRLIKYCVIIYAMRPSSAPKRISMADDLMAACLAEAADMRLPARIENITHIIAQ